MFGRTSDAFMGESAGRSKLERIHAEAKQIINEKNKEIKRYSDEIQKTEITLQQLKSELKEKTARLKNDPFEVSLDNIGNQAENQIAEINMRHEREVEELKTKNEEELQAYKLKYGKMLKESEQWIEQHVDTVYLEKSAKLEAAKQDLEQIKQQASEAMLGASKQRVDFYRNSKTATLMNSKRIDYLESQLSEIASVSREEVRDIKAKIEECLAAIAVRENEHKAEIAKYKKELEEREKKYNEHLEILQTQCNTEKSRYQNQINATNENIQNLSRVLKQLEKHHESQLKSTLRDLERMKTTIYATKTRKETSPDEAIATVKETNTLSNKCMQMQQEIAVIESELNELNDENRELKAQLKKFDSIVYA